MTSLSPGVPHADMANALRALAMDAVEAAQSGHPGMPMGMADVATVLFTRFLKFDAGAPEWPDRDRFVLSAGHGSMLLYALLHLTGYEDLPRDELERFRQVGARTAGHPEYGHAEGIETTTGPLGQGISNAVGMALAERMLAARLGDDLVDHFTYVIASDGDLMEGISHEAASLAGHLGLGKLIVLYDDNGISIDGATDLACSDDVLGRFEAYGWQALGVDGHDLEAIEIAIAAARDDARPSLIACRTVIGHGAPDKQGTAATHGAPLGAEEVMAARKNLGWPYPPFEIPTPIADAWRAIGARGEVAREAWQARLEQSPAERAVLQNPRELDLGDALKDVVAEHKRRLAEERPKWATRKASQEILGRLTEALPALIGGSADLTDSNNTKTKATAVISRGSFEGRYVHYGVREHAMAAIMNGIALHGGFVPYGGTFLIFSDYSRPAIRLAALMGLRVIHVHTHDSIGLGEDGPTHQPIEHLASLRAMPNLHVFRPADAMETAECWELALERTAGPSVLALSRQGVPAIRHEASPDNACARGAYVLDDPGQRDVTILATGSEVHLALEAAAALEAEGIRAAVVSMPCLELFEAQDEAFREAVLGNAPRIAVEAAAPFGWTRYVAKEDDVIGMRGFGHSGPGPDVFRHFGITTDAIVAKARAAVRVRRAA